jgi:ElaB/YqjD/DUF883 family membrane-anchored ribosome-binding protein
MAQTNTPYPEQSAGVRQGAEVMKDKAHTSIERLSTGAHDTVDRAASMAASAADRLLVKSEALAAAKDQWIDTTRGYVREHPLAAVGFALAAGYLLSRITSRY